jgi:PEP-CTERM motif
MKKIILPLLTLAALAITLTTQAVASVATAIDYTTMNIADGASFSTYPRGVVFQTGQNPENIDGVTFKFYSNNPASVGAMTAYLYNVDATNLPTGSPVASQLGMAYSQTVNGDHDLTFTGNEISNLSSFLMLPGQKYALILQNPTQATTLWWDYGTDGIGSYTTTNGFSVLADVHGTGGTTWVQDTNAYMLKLDVSQASAVPEPTTYALFCIGMGVVGYARKRLNVKLFPKPH